VSIESSLLGVFAQQVTQALLLEGRWLLRRGGVLQETQRSGRAGGFVGHTSRALGQFGEVVGLFQGLHCVLVLQRRCILGVIHLGDGGRGGVHGNWQFGVIYLAVSSLVGVDRLRRPIESIHKSQSPLLRHHAFSALIFFRILSKALGWRLFLLLFKMNRHLLQDHVSVVSLRRPRNRLILSGPRKHIDIVERPRLALLRDIVVSELHDDSF